MNQTTNSIDFKVKKAAQSSPFPLMESPLQEVWEAAAGNPFVPTIGKDIQFYVGISLLTIGALLAGFFGLSGYFLS